jgi:hypothetical protein
MFKSRYANVVIPIVTLLVGFGVGTQWAGGTKAAPASTELSTSDMDNMVADAEANVAAAQRDYDQAMANLNSPTPPSSFRPDPQMQMGERHAIELNEMICRQTGQNCELAQMARRQYNEKYGLGR